MVSSEELKISARELGFQLVGITSAQPPAHLEHYSHWLDAGYHAGMAYMATERNRNRRAEPKEILPACKSIICLGTRYPDPGRLSRENDTSKGKIAAYAWGKDYHDVLAEKMDSLVSSLQKMSAQDFPYRWYTDSGPVLERELAQRAGMGWIGKNTCLINPQSGSYYFLAEIFVGLDLEPDSPFVYDHCGSCTRCIDACPTQCILTNRMIDSNRCISYLTIENKGSVNSELRGELDGWVFGCDICQQVCPWNIRFSDSNSDPVFDSGPGNPSPNLLQEISLDAESFNRKFKHSPIKRAKRMGYIRNIILASSFIGQPAVAGLAKCLHDNDPIIRAHAAWALGKIGGVQAREALVGFLVIEQNPGVLDEIEEAIKYL